MRAEPLRNGHAETDAASVAETDHKELDAGGGADGAERARAKIFPDDGSIHHAVHLLQKAAHQKRKSEKDDQPERITFCHFFHNDLYSLRKTETRNFGMHYFVLRSQYYRRSCVKIEVLKTEKKREFKALIR